MIAGDPPFFHLTCLMPVGLSPLASPRIGEMCRKATERGRPLLPPRRSLSSWLPLWGELSRRLADVTERGSAHLPSSA